MDIQVLFPNKITFFFAYKNSRVYMWHFNRKSVITPHHLQLQANLNASDRNTNRNIVTSFKDLPLEDT